MDRHEIQADLQEEPDVWLAPELDELERLLHNHAMFTLAHPEPEEDTWRYPK